MTSELPSSFSKRHRLPIHYIRCKDRYNLDCYFFLMCSHQKIKLLQKKINADDGIDSINLASCGAIIASGYGKEPSEATKQLLSGHYNYIMQ
jgi:hypothetical protein